MSSWSIQDLFKPTDNPFVTHSVPSPGFSCVADGVDIWTFPGEIELLSSKETAHSESREIRTSWLHRKTGLSADIVYTYFSDTNSLEYRGSLRNGGPHPLKNFRGPFSLTFCANRAKVGIPRLLSLTGGASCDSTYPTPTFSPRVVDLTGALTLSSGEGGMSTKGDMPFVVMSTQDEQYGVAAALEWPSSWMCYSGARRVEGADWPYVLLHLDKTCLTLEPGDTIPLPGIILSFFSGGLQQGCNCMRRHIRRHVTPPIDGRKIVPPVFYNHWFGCGNNISTTAFKPIVDVAAELGLEYFVIDTGWFEGGFREGAGNWEKPDRTKMPDGMGNFARYVESKGMKFGTWLELEYARPGTDWAVRHPEWFRTCRSTSDLLLRIEDPSVRKQVMEFLVRFIEENHVSWIRWDFNTHPGQFWEGVEDLDNRGWLQIRYAEGLFALLDEVIARFPNLHIEACAGGGHRMDLGTLRRAHSCWMNDNSVVIPALRSRLKGMNHYLPGNYGNTCLCNMAWEGDQKDTRSLTTDKLPVSYFRNGYPLDFIRSRMGGSLGFSEDFTLYNKTVKAQVKLEIARYKSVRRYLMEDFYPLFNTRGLRDWDGWQFHDPNDSSGFLMAFRNQSKSEKEMVSPGGWDNGVTYLVENMDTGKKKKVKGSEEVQLKIGAIEETAWLRYAPA
jgi:alpha-galactosidase